MKVILFYKFETPKIKEKRVVLKPTLDHLAMQQTSNINYLQLLIQQQNNCANT